MSTINLVQIYTLGSFTSAQMRQLTALAYQIARDRHIYPKALLIRGNIYRTTSVNGRYVSDPKGNHVTVCFKDEEHILHRTHVASQGYISNPTDNFLREITHSEVKSDRTIKKGGKEVWPATLEKTYEVAFSHLSNGFDGSSSSGTPGSGEFASTNLAVSGRSPSPCTFKYA